MANTVNIYYALTVFLFLQIVIQFYCLSYNTTSQVLKISISTFIHRMTYKKHNSIIFRIRFLRIL